MLSFTAVHALSRCLFTTCDEATTVGWGDQPTLLLIHDRRADRAGATVPVIRSVEFPVHPDDLPADPSELPALLHRLALALHDTDATSVSYRSTLDTIIELIRLREPAARLLAWAVLYDDVHTVDGPPRRTRRIDAVDVDGRLYQLTQLPGEDQPMLVVDDTPEPADTPATGPGLTALLTATARFTGGGLVREVTP
ncbi:hypothetical protein O7627_33415 [Solwaraspora sp. WMMD1047]|uniref:hypothetical protein n=1 Tax=Solwaraspora sp. WMMD1047 TaxID=3016102 RepID=UPI002415E7BA|nr:hypothetical protein [Solwaraspora sp. WMMD1047]MDG4834166.1 hypothetical protein [Solwaraspora sp. WMMD1047]